MSDWIEYQKLVLSELEKNSKSISDLKADMDDQFDEVKEEISKLKAAKQFVIEQKQWKDKVTDVWSPPQMKEAKDEIYIQKSQWGRVIGILIGVELVVGIIVFFFKK